MQTENIYSPHNISLIKRTLFVLVGIFLWQSSGANKNTKEYCAVTQKEMAKMQEQLPMSVDASGLLVGVNAIYINDVCYKNYIYSIDTEKFVQIIKKSELTYTEAYSWLKTTDGRIQLISLMNENVSNFVQLRLGGNNSKSLRKLKIKEKMIFTYNFDDPSILPVEVVAVDTTQ